MNFANPEWLLCLFALPILGFVSWLAWKKRGERWKRMIAPRLQGRLTQVRAPWVHFTALGLALAGLGALMIAVAQPESGEEWIEIENEGRNILFCVDISRSMLAEDVAPNRLLASRAAALEILERFPDDRVGVLLFSGEVLVQSPLTIDHSFVEQTLAQLDPNDIPYGGSNLTDAIDAGVKLLVQTGQQSNVMVVFSDGEKSSEGLERAATSAADEGVFIYSLGMGTPSGSFIPDSRERDGKFRDRAGNVVFTQLDEEALQILSERTEGYYSRGIGSDFLGKLDSALIEMDRFREEGKHQRVAKPAHQWFVFGGLLFIMTSIYIRCLPLGPVVTLAMLLMLMPQADAGLIEDGVAALNAGDSQAAHEQFHAAAKLNSGDRAASLYLAAGSAASQVSDWESAVDSFSEAVSAEDEDIQQKAHYALATSLFYLGAPLEKEEKIKAWRGSIEHFEASLKLLPEHGETAANLKSVKEQLAALEKETPQEQANEQPPPEEDEKKKDEEKENEKPEDENQDSQDGEDPDDREKKDPGESGDPKNEDGDPKNNEDPKDDEGDSEKNPSRDEKENKNGQPDGQKEPQEGNSESEGDQQPDPNSNQGAPKQGPEEEKPAAENESQLKDDPNAPKGESRADRARRILKQYSDFGEKAPRRIRRPYNRSAQDW